MADSKPGVHVLQLKPISVPKCMIEGEKFLKWEEDSSSVTPVNLKVDPCGYFLYWTDQNEETQFLDLFTIRDARTARFAKVPKDPKMRDQVNIGVAQDSLEEKTLTVVYGPDFVNVSFVNFCTTKKEVIKVWADELLKMAYNILGLNGSVLSFMRKAFVKLTLQADKAGRIAVKNIVRMFAQHRDDRRRVEKALADIGLPAGKDDVISQTEFQFTQFFQLCKVLSGRQEIHKICEELCGSKKKLMTVDQFVQFLNRHQRDPRLNEILYPYANPSRALDLISQYEPNKSNAQKGLLSEDGLLRFLLSEDNNIVSSHKYDLSHDMDQPLCHYFINSSHNTYLTGHQFTGKSSVEIYRQTLLGGCRCVELDFWNGKNEDPIIYHGYTLVPEVPAKEVIEAIAESAFKTSDFPVILSFENHCNTKQQAKIAQYCREIFGDMLLDSPLETHLLEPGVPLPSPAMLKRKIIIKNKKKVQHQRKNCEKAVKPESSPVAVQGNGEIPRPRLEKDESRESATEEEEETAAGEAEDAEVGSESDDDEDESTTSNLSPEEIRQREKAQKDKGTAGKESEAGAEISALVNYVQPVHFHSFEHAERRCRSNEMSSFVETQATALLKEHPIEFVNYNKRQLSRIYPRGTRVDSSNFMPQVFWNAGCQLVALNFQTLDLAMQLNLGIFEFNGRTGYLLKPQFMRRSDKKFDPFAESTVDGIIAGTVSVQVISGQFVSDRRVSSYVEVDMFGLPADTVRKRFRTKTVINNGINPVYDEEPFVFKKVVLPELACLRIAVYEDSGRQIGHCVLPVTGLCPGYRHIMLRNEAGQPLNMATLFVNIMVKDYVPDGLSTLAEALVNPIKYQSELEKRAKQLSVLTGETEDSLEDLGDGLHRPLETKPSDGANQKLSVCSTVSQYPSSPRGRTADDVSPNTEADGNSISKRQDSTKQSFSFGGSRSSGGTVDESVNSAPPSSPKSAEPVEQTIVAETLEKLMEHKAVRKVRDKLVKKLDELRKDYDKEKYKLDEEMGLVTKNKNSSRLMKRLSSKNLHKDSAQNKGNLQVYEQQKVALFRRMKEDEKELRKKYHELIYTALEKCVTESQEKQLRLLKEQHDAQIDGAQKLVQAQTSREFKDLNRKHRDKDELDRAKREKREEIVKKGVAERDRLGKQYVKKKEELERQYEDLKRTFDEERVRNYVKIERDYEVSVSASSPAGAAAAAAASPPPPPCSSSSS